MGELGTYKPYDYPRLCDVCGFRRRISTMTKHAGGVWVCDIHTDERTAEELSKLKPRIYNIIPVPDAKGESFYPDVMEAEDAIIINFVDRMVVAGTRYEQVISGMPTPLSGHKIEGLSWSARYLYSIITDTTVPARVVTHAKGLLLSIASQLIARQQGFGLSASSTKTNDAFWGGFYESGASYWYSEDTATAGLALLYAYRVFGTASYIVSARAAASFLRNVQAIGKNGTHFTSGDSAGTARLYTGGLASYVANVSGFYSDSRFFPSSLLALQFWNELKTTDGDRQIGSDGTPTGFDTIPQQLMSLSITDLRTFWSDGVRDAALETYTGLSSTTPREYFNAYPASKPNANITGTGRWEFQDGGASTGTAVTSLNFAKALSALYAYEGASSQVTAIDDWLRSFTSNADFETPDNTSDRDLARSTTGDYDPTLCLSTLLLVRDSANAYTSIALNGSSLYEWGGFGLLSSLWANRHGGTFPDARQSVFGSKERFDDGVRSDNDYVDWISLRGLSGLTYQTAFSSTLSGTDQGALPVGSGTAVTSPPTEGLVFWVKGNSGLVRSSDGLRLLTWANQATLGSNPGLASTGVDGANGPAVGLDSANGVPGVTFTTAAFTLQEVQLGTKDTPVLLKDRNGVNFGYGPGETQTRTTVHVLKPRYAPDVFALVGGGILRFGTTATGGLMDYMPVFDLEGGSGDWWLFSTAWRIDGAAQQKGPSTTGGASGPYTDVLTTVITYSSGFNDIHVLVNGTEIALTPSAMQTPGSQVAKNYLVYGGTAVAGPGQAAQWHGARYEDMIYDHVLSPADLATLNQYLSGTYSGTGAVTALMVNDVVRSSMFGLSIRQTPTAQTVPS